MSSFDDIEISSYDGTPILLYDFMRTSGGSDYHWRYNSSDGDVLYLGRVYKATAIADDGVKQDSEATNSELNITMPITDDFPQMFRGSGSTPSDTTYITIRRAHISDQPGHPVWTTGTVESTSDGAIEALASGASMLPGGANVVSPSGEFELAFQVDQNVVLIQHHGLDPDTVLWATGTAGSGANALIMQTDGNLVLYNGATPIWASGTDAYPGATLYLQNDGNLVIYSASGDLEARVFWVGTVVGLTQEDEVKARITCQMLLASFKRGGLRLSYTRGCPHALYDPQCTLNSEDFKFENAVVSFSSNVINLTDLSIFANGYFDGGFIRWVLPSGMVERRGINSHTGNTIVVQGSTFGITAGDDVFLFPGCRRTRQVCNDKFSNILNYGGFPDTPGKSPFSGEPVF